MLVVVPVVRVPVVAEPDWLPPVRTPLAVVLPPVGCVLLPPTVVRPVAVWPALPVDTTTGRSTPGVHVFCGRGAGVPGVRI